MKVQAKHLDLDRFFGTAYETAGGYVIWNFESESVSVRQVFWITDIGGECMRALRMAYKILVRKSQETNLFGRSRNRPVWEDTFKVSLSYRLRWLDSSGLCPAVGCFKRDNERLVSTQCGESLHQLRDYQLLTDSTSWRHCWLTISKTLGMR